MSRVATASAVGTVIEFYDFTVFATAAALVFNKVFFPSLGPAAGTAIALATFGVAFVVRPFGAVLFGHFGDRLGRKNTLVATLVLMGLATVGIGVLPTAGAIGPAAAILLVVLRCVQGLAMGGEWAGASLVTTENAPPDKRGLFGMFPQLGPSIGFILSTATFLLTALTMSDAAFLSWGWRIPFLASAVLIIVGLVVRATLEETEVFQSSVVAAAAVVKLPVVSLFTRQWREVVLATGSCIAVFGLFYVGITYLTTFGTQNLGLTRTAVLLVGIAGAASLGLTTVLSAMWSDRIGRRAVLLIGNGLSLVVSLALFPIIEGGTVLAFLVGVVVLQAAVGVTYGPLGAYLPELFAPRYRYTGAGLSYNLATVLGGALTPLIASELIARFGTFTVGLYLAGLCAVTVVAILLSRETRSTGRTADPVDESGRDEVPLPFDAVPEAPTNAR
jgi:metabolite-proton symporter